MVQATDLGNRYDRPHPGRLNGPPKRRILAEREVRAGALVVVEVRFQDAPQTSLIQDNDVIQAFPTNRADQSLNVSVLPCRKQKSWLCYQVGAFFKHARNVSCHDISSHENPLLWVHALALNLSSALRFRRRRCRRRQIAGVDFVGKPNDLVGTVAEGLVGGVAATAKRDFRPAGEPEGFSSGIDNLEVAFDPQRTVVRGSDFRCGHGCLRQEFSGGAPSNKPLRYVGARTNSTRGFFALTGACSLKKRYCCELRNVVLKKFTGGGCNSTEQPLVRWSPSMQNRHFLNRIARPLGSRPPRVKSALNSAVPEVIMRPLVQEGW